MEKVIRTMHLKNKVVIVTGAGAGIGRASASAFAQAGAKVVVVDKVETEGKETVQMIKDNGGEAVFIKADVSRDIEVAAMVDKAVQIYGEIDCAHNNAGISGDIAPTAQCSEENWDRTIDINLKGIWLCMKYEIQSMLRHGGGVIVNTASAVGLVGSAIGRPAYVASKHGVVGLTKAAALEYAKENIRVNAVCPGIIRTKMVQTDIDRDHELEAVYMAKEPIGRIGTPEEVAEAAVWLCSDASSFITGHALAVDGGFVAI
jgi:NAD(P)-dependent dehydrogenase (short-subunit alcohol dehydrogenase family)